MRQRGLACTTCSWWRRTPLTTQSTLQKESAWKGSIEAHSNTCRYNKLPSPLTVFPWSLLQCSSSVICASLLCVDLFTLRICCATPLAFIALIQVQWDTSHLSAHSPQSPWQVVCSYCNYHWVFLCCPYVYTSFHILTEGSMGSACAGNYQVVPDNFLK